MRIGCCFLATNITRNRYQLISCMTSLQTIRNQIIHRHTLAYMFEMFPQFPCCTLRVNGCAAKLSESASATFILSAFICDTVVGGWLGLPGALMANLSKPRKYIYASYACGHKIFYINECASFVSPLRKPQTRHGGEGKIAVCYARAFLLLQTERIIMCLSFGLCVCVSAARSSCKIEVKIVLDVRVSNIYIYSVHSRQLYKKNQQKKLTPPTI